MKKRLFSLLLVLALILAALPLTALAAGTLDNFTEKRSYPTGKFADVTTDKWFFDNVKRGYELGLIDGRAEDTFGPDLFITYAETIKLAACLHSIYYTGSANFIQGAPWYQVYFDYAFANGILDWNERDLAEYADKYISRSEVVLFFARALPKEVFPRINYVEDKAIPDIRISIYTYNPDIPQSIYMFYRAGILTGKNEAGIFEPVSNILRSEIATILTRIVDVSLRKSFALIYNDFVLSTQHVVLNAGESEEIYITINANTPIGQSSIISSNKSVAQGKWESLFDPTYSIIIQGFSPGTATISVHIGDSNNMPYEVINITVDVY